LPFGSGAPALRAVRPIATSTTSGFFGAVRTVPSPGSVSIVCSATRIAASSLRASRSTT
jgi:hypothetical protein